MPVPMYGPVPQKSALLVQLHCVKLTQSTGHPHSYFWPTVQVRFFSKIPAGNFRIPASLCWRPIVGPGKPWQCLEPGHVGLYNCYFNYIHTELHHIFGVSFKEAEGLSNTLHRLKWWRVLHPNSNQKIIFKYCLQ